MAPIPVELDMGVLLIYIMKCIRVFSILLYFKYIFIIKECADPFNGNDTVDLD